MKKFLAVCLSAALAASMLVGCGGKNEKVTAKVNRPTFSVLRSIFMYYSNAEIPK